jgi:riboflavin synthase
MFTGIITEIGKVKARVGGKLEITAPQSVTELKIGDSICVNGVCLTVVKKDNETFSADVLTETLSRTNLVKLKKGDLINLELALKVGDRLGGHIVTGHVDCTGKLIRKYKKQNDTVLEIEVPLAFGKNIIQKGSVAVNGISLTVASIVRNKLNVHIIPHTLKSTNLINCKIGQLINIETDKYLTHS